MASQNGAHTWQAPAVPPIPPVKDVMTPFPHFVDVKSGPEEARKILSQHKIRHLPVKEGGQVVGLVTERDLDVAGLGAREGGRPITLDELCEKDVYCVGLHDPVDEVVREMSRRKVGCALVIRDGKLAGIVTTSDVCRLYGELLRKLAPPSDEPA